MGPDADRVGYRYIYLHITTCGTRDRVGHRHSECYAVLLYILTRLWDMGLAGLDTIDTIVLLCSNSSCGTRDLLMQTELVIAIFTYI